MLFPYHSTEYTDQAWRQINMRKVAHLIGAEMLHNLYNRHWPRINSLRFRNTIVSYKDGIVKSYAPVEEWQYLQRWLSEKFLHADLVLIREIRAIMSPTYDIVDELIARIDSLQLDAVSDQELALLLVDIMDIPLGEIYKLNVVQIEYSLNHALHQLLQVYEPNETDRNELLSHLIAPGVLTVSQEEEVAFGELMLSEQFSGVSDPRKHKELLLRITEHHATYSPVHCAYGEKPPSVNDYIEKYRFMYAHHATPTTRRSIAVQNVKQQQQDSEALLHRLNDGTLTELCELMASIGVFRDQNKAKLGHTVVRRFRIIDEIARRTMVPVSDLNYYLMAELTTLLDTGLTVDERTISARRDDGVTFVRQEHLAVAERKIKLSRGPRTDSLTGICASAGIIEGPVKVIHTKEDIGKMNSGDIMVATGTDFDLLDIMHLAGGIITEEGGLLSHASVVGRELHKPCLIGVARVMERLKDGDMVRLDATDGTVIILKEGSQ